MKLMESRSRRGGNHSDIVWYRQAKLVNHAASGQRYAESGVHHGLCLHLLLVYYAGNAVSYTTTLNPQLGRMIACLDRFYLIEN